MHMIVGSRSLSKSHKMSQVINVLARLRTKQLIEQQWLQFLYFFFAWDHLTIIYGVDDLG